MTKRIQHQELRTYKHQNLMNELNEMMIRIKRHLFFVTPGATIKPTYKELDEITNKVLNALKEDSKPSIKYKSYE